jgi:hypothetical protein
MFSHGGSLPLPSARHPQFDPWFRIQLISIYSIRKTLSLSIFRVTISAPPPGSATLSTHQCLRAQARPHPMCQPGASLSAPPASARHSLTSVPWHTLLRRFLSTAWRMARGFRLPVPTTMVSYAASSRYVAENFVPLPSHPFYISNFVHICPLQSLIPSILCSNFIGKVARLMSMDWKRTT